MQDIGYTFDNASNVTGIVNNAGVVNTLGGAYRNTYRYDALHRLVESYGGGDIGNYNTNLSYSPSGRLRGKFRGNNSVTLSASVEMAYGYCDDYQPHAVKRMFDYKNGMLYDLRWDEAGNLGQVSMARPDEMFEGGRFLYWTEDSRMHAAVDDRYYSYYAYDHSGERRLKLTGQNDLLDVNADFMSSYTILTEPTLYPSAYMVLTNKGYTNVTEVERRTSSLVLPRCSNVTEGKHYYAGTERVAARLGGGGLNALCRAVGSDEELQTQADLLFGQSLDQVNSRVLQENDLHCIMHNDFAKEEFGHWIDGIPYQMQAGVELNHDQFKDMVNSMLDDINHGQEKEVYFYHSDHLGSASWITDFSGVAVQHIQYLPYGEPYINQHPFGYSERFTFTGKERDEETSYGYFGARYMDHELTTMWLSVDPMADKYPSISPYAYCAWNPVKLVDPDGQEYGDYFSSTGVWLGSDGINDGKLYRQVDFTDINSCLRNDYVEVGAPYSYAGTYEYVGNVTNITMDYTGTMAPDKNNNPHIAKGVFTITFHVGDQEFVRGKYEAWSGCNYKDGSVRYPLQNGEWMLANSDRPVSTSQKNSYTRDNACFKIDLSPVGFTTARYGIQIHPDGGANGTAGCIGIRTNPSDFYNAYKSCVSLHPNLKVNVNIKNNPNNNVPR